MRLSAIVIGFMAAAGLVFQSDRAEAALITSSAGFASPTIVDFSQFSGGFTSGSGPVEVGGLVGESITWQPSNSGSVIGNGGYGLGGNGNWDAGRLGYTGLNRTFDFMDFLFATPVNGVGGFINYVPGNGSPVEIIALDSVSNPLESFDLLTVAPISTPGALNDGAFRGISRAADDIFGFRVTNAVVVLDDLTFTRSATAIPEPAGLALLSLSLVGISWARRRRSNV